MVTITIKGTTFRINRIVAFGCSFTAGAEILDHLMPPEIFELKKTLDAFEWYHAIEKDPKHMKQLLELREEERYHAWPAHLAKLLGIDFESYAQVGNSNEHMCWQIQQRIASSDLTEHDLVLVGRTSPQRAMYFSEFDTNPVPFLFSHSSQFVPQLTKHILRWFNDDRIVWNYLRDLQSFNISKQKLGNRLFVVPMEHIVQEICPWPPTDMYGTFRSISNNNAMFFNKLIGQEHKSDLFLTTDHYLYQYNTSKTYLPHGHLNESAHMQFAQELLTRYITIE